MSKMIIAFLSMCIILYTSIVPYDFKGIVNVGR